MKQILSLVFAGIIGGLIVLGLSSVLNVQGSSDIGPGFSKQVNYNLPAGAGTAPAVDFVAAAEIAMPVVVHIEANGTSKIETNENPFRFFFGDDFLGKNYPQKGMGSGVIHSSDGYIVTNSHVIDFASEVWVTLSDNRKFKAEVVGKDEQTDLAVLKIDSYGLPTFEYANSDDARVGEWVLAVGNPFDLTSTVTAGIISAKGRDINIIPNKVAIEAFIQTDAAVNPGNSGGALVDSRGNLLGINTAIATQNGAFQGYSFAIPVNMMEKIVDDIIKYGSYQRGFLGISISDMDNELAEGLGINVTQGIYVHSTKEGGAAQYAGVLPNDVITEVNGKRVKSVPELQEVVGRAKIGDTLKLTINRKGKAKEIPVRLTAG